MTDTSGDPFVAEEFERLRPHLRSVAYRVLGSLTEAEDAVQEAWLRLHRSDRAEIDNLGGWLTTVVARVSLTLLKARRSRRESGLADLAECLPDPIVTPVDSTPSPEEAVLLADSLGLALLVVLDTLTPTERLTFVLHDMFGVGYDEIARMVERSPEAARKAASRARRRVRGSGAVPDPDPARQRAVVDAFLAATRDGDIAGLVRVLAPDVVLRADTGILRVVAGAPAVAQQAAVFRRLAHDTRPVLVNGVAGLANGAAVMAFTVRDGLITEIDILGDKERLARLDLTFPDDETLPEGAR
ncbi:sigma-70 family RNA polymerase sigma factor [Actinomadura sp. NEAU-AAG7]|uniref:sigma-70 family RNA polymerase sigma factor n=1 Tax=Actinomadura sp. NEAU-AAG7 TaxID=2839640 RepID=UPI001BE444B5|nr:sigma-70 family RNA polymerase sigma factor [Actinomadura sp. NEAU-AAG7]MBT2210185.1 sigma-70 family RNA polymerase sigma factor [Actinomadura sp. NEAU-AAG7]